MTKAIALFGRRADTPARLSEFHSRRESTELVAPGRWRVRCGIRGLGQASNLTMSMTSPHASTWRIKAPVCDIWCGFCALSGWAASISGKVLHDDHLVAVSR